MCRVVKGEVIEFRIPGGTKKWMLLRELCQYFIEFNKYLTRVIWILMGVCVCDEGN